MYTNRSKAPWIYVERKIKKLSYQTSEKSNFWILGCYVITDPGWLGQCFWPISNSNCYGLFWSLHITGKNPVGLRFCNKNWFTYSLLFYKYTEKIIFWKVFWDVTSRIGSIIGEESETKSNSTFLKIHLIW